MLPSWASQTVAITEPTWVSERGTKIATYAGAGVNVAGCSVQPGGSSEDVMMRQGVTVRATAFLPPGTAVTAQARVTVDGVHYAIDGAPEVWASPTGAVSHVKLVLVDWVG